MTREEWNACNDPHVMTRFLSGKASDRKFMLFACGCCRANGTLMAHPRADAALTAVEDCADGLSNTERVFAVCDATPAEGGVPNGLDWVKACLTDDGSFATMLTLIDLRHVGRGVSRRGCADIARCVFGNRCRTAPRKSGWLEAAALGVVGLFAGHPGLTDPEANKDEPLPAPTADPTWPTSTVTAIAAGIYESRDFSSMPILADALQDTGCEDVAVLDHCRDDGVRHVRGCWVVDLVLGKL